MRGSTGWCCFFLYTDKMRSDRKVQEPLDYCRVSPYNDFVFNKKKR